eukprot:GDKI01044227.1.p1 GENE.GDKI01044227.1~~GDKI01044227.1.p1  ORF type:complete len:335 (+),score=37.93 GDKI01044227.1:108-1007(+)
MRTTVLLFAVCLLLGSNAPTLSGAAFIRSHEHLTSSSKGVAISISSAIYGRTENGAGVCPNAGKDQVPSNGCARDVLWKMPSIFSTSDNYIPAGKNLNDYFGDPCKGVHKYLSIEYKCAGDPTEVTWKRRAVRCEGINWHWYLDCSTDSTLDADSNTIQIAPFVLKYAAFGVTPYGDQGQCSAPSFTSVSTCQWDVTTRVGNILAQRGNVIPGNTNGATYTLSNMLNLSSLCPGTNKYLTVMYYCGTDTTKYYTATNIRCDSYTNDWQIECDPRRAYSTQASFTLTKTSSSVTYVSSAV